MEAAMTRIPREWSIGVIVPARNEEATIKRCIESIMAAAGHSGRADSLWIVVVADACSDATAQIARRELGTFGRVLACNVRSAGTARRLGVEAVLEHFHGVDAHSIWLANTDADTSVPVDWIDIHLGFADDGVTGVAGIVQLNTDGCVKAHEIYRTTYHVQSDGTHTHVHGANIAVRADAYLDVGGWRDLTLSEDHCLWGRLRSRGWRVSSPVRSVVLTSARLVGRARGGFADTLEAQIDATYARP
jgi:cellulose synthase/poly-beta-1,6-N-acetylglucosamine synthase-like glycosyltransferase